MKRISALSLLLLSACTMAPEFKLPDISMPDTWKNTPKQEASAPHADDSWWKGFGSDELPQLITQAEKENPDLAAADARIAEARATARIAGAPLFPELSLDGSAGRNYSSRHQTGAKSNYNGGVNASYELDLFGRNLSGARSADWLAKASAFDREALHLSITSQTAESYFAALALNERVTIAEKNLTNAREVLDVTKKREASGALSPLEVAQQQNFVGSSEATLATLKQQREAAQNALAVLVGQTPQKFTMMAQTPKALTPPDVPVSVPAEWIARRPDIASAEAELKSAGFDVGAARAAFFPSLNLSAGVAIAAAPISASSAVLSSLAASVTQPLFTGGTLEGGLERATAHQKEVAANYRKVVLTAFAETENALNAIESQRQREDALKMALDAARTAYDASRSRFNAGAIDSITLLDAQRTLLSAEDALAGAHADRLSASVDLFRAMGGGWEGVGLTAPTPVPVVPAVVTPPASNKVDVEQP